VAKRSRPDGIFDYSLASSAWNYVANSRDTALTLQDLKSVGHIFDFATLRIKCCRQHFMQQIRTSGSMSGV
jgi:hypothetical protein